MKLAPHRRASLLLIAAFFGFAAPQSAKTESFDSHRARVVTAAPPHSVVEFRARRKIDLDGDGKSETVDVDSMRTRTLEVRDGKGVTRWRGVQNRVRPWRLETGDVDGDGRSEIALGVWKATKFFPRPHNCLSIYSWNGRACVPKWLGSGLSQPFTEFVFARLDAARADSLIALERGRNGRFSVAVYRWNYFGFDLIRRVGSWKNARDLRVASGRVRIVADGSRRTVATVFKGKS